MTDHQTAVDEAATITCAATLAAETDRERLISNIGQLLSVKLKDVRKLGERRGIYELMLVDGRFVELGTSANVLNQHRVRAELADATTDLFKPMKPWVWDLVATAIFKAARVEATKCGPEDEMKFWLTDLAKRNTPQTIDKSNSAETASTLRGSLSALYHSGDDRLLVHVPSLLPKINLHYCQRVTLQDATLRLRRMGFKSEQIGARYKDEKGDGVAKSRFWRSPRDFHLGE